MSLFEGIVGGGMGGLAGAALGPLASVLLVRYGKAAVGDAALGALALGLLLGTMAFGLSRKLKPSLAGLLAGALSVLVPALLLPRALLVVSIAGLFGTMALVGYMLGGWRGALGGAGGGLAGYVLTSAMPAVPLLGGLLMGAGMGAGLSFTSRRKI